MSARAEEDSNGHVWQYHSRSDHHSKVACWGVLFDLLLECPVLRDHVVSGAVVFGINHGMRDFKNNRPKKLDLVLCRPQEASGRKGRPQPSFRGLVDKHGIRLTSEEKKLLAELPDIQLGEVGSVQLAMEAKACMTEHIKARPRLYDELNSSHETIHASADEAIAVGFVMINVGEEFLSPERQLPAALKKPLKISRHKQPDVTERVMAKIHEMPRRTKLGEQGFDALSIVVVACRNDGSPVRLVQKPPAPAAGDIYEYGAMIRRVAQTYASRFRTL